MDNTFLNIVAFVLITILYYVVIKPKLSIDILTDVNAYKDFNKNSYFRLGIYFLLVLLVQFGINASVIINKCGGSVSQNVGVSGIITFLPWVLIFGIVIIVLIVFPGFKSAFSDVIGYFYVSKRANDVLTELLMNTKIDRDVGNENVHDVIQREPEPEPEPEPQPQQGGERNKKTLQDAADAILKLCGNMSIIINQIVPGNFIQYMEILKPLMKEKYETNPALLKTKEQELLELVVTRDNIGEAFWYIYTAILLISITQYNIASRPCIKDPATIKANYDKFLADQEAKNKEKAKSQGVYTIKT